MYHPTRRMYYRLRYTCEDVAEVCPLQTDFQGLDGNHKPPSNCSPEKKAAEAQFFLFNSGVQVRRCLDREIH